MDHLFQECNELEYLDLSNILLLMLLIWIGCYKLKEIKGINNFNTSQVINMKRN